MPRTARAPCPDTQALQRRVGQTVERLRRAREMSISALSEQSGVAKSMISQIERNEANPSVATLFRLGQALGAEVGSLVGETPEGEAFVELARAQDTPLVRSEDGLCELRILSSIDTVGWAQVYDFTAQAGGVLESSAHPVGTVESLSVLQGALVVSIGAQARTVEAGQTLRYRADRDHVIVNPTDETVRATMVCLRKPQ